MIYTGSIAENLIPEKTIGETVQQLLNTDIGGFSLGNIPCLPCADKAVPEIHAQGPGKNEA